MPYTAITSLYPEVAGHATTSTACCHLDNLIQFSVNTTRQPPVQATDSPVTSLLPAGNPLQHCRIGGNIDLYNGSLSPADASMHVLCFSTICRSNVNQPPSTRQKCILALLCTDAIIVQLEDLSSPCLLLQTLFVVSRVLQPLCMSFATTVSGSFLTFL